LLRIDGVVKADSEDKRLFYEIEKENMIIRAAEEHDIPKILEILKGYNMGHFGHAERGAMPKTEHFLVAEEGDRLVGCCAYLLSGESDIAKALNEAETGSLAVITEFRGKGVGEKLQRARMERLYHLGITTLFTETDRVDTINWYMRKFGYKKLSTRKKKVLDFGDPGVDTFTLLEVNLAEWFSKL
jgi:N-acetylglutamate synthase-like GNAT family acetyltransferase